jgi:hypothetical protein
MAVKALHEQVARARARSRLPVMRSLPLPEARRQTRSPARKPDWQGWMNTLVREYDAGRLVPFLGAGMSRKVCPDWKGFIKNLEGEAGLRDSKPDKSADALTRRGMRAVRLLRRRDPDTFAQAIDRALAHDPDEKCPQTRALAQIWWPLVLTTNYDDLYLTQAFKKWDNDRESSAAAAGAEPRIPSTLVFGRSNDDCQAIVRSLWEPSRPILWAMHGFLRRNPEKGEPVDRYNRLATELVIGHEEYRRTIHTAVHFRRAFAEVYRNRSFLFLGSSLKDPHLLGLFDEILEVGGPSPRPHFAVVAGEREVPNANFFRTRLNTQIIQIDDYRNLPRFLHDLRKRIDAGRPRTMTWAFSMRAKATVIAERPASRLEISRSGLPPRLDAGHCVAISAGTDGGANLFLSHWMRDYLGTFRSERTNKIGINPPPPPELPADPTRHVVRHPHEPVFFAAARDRTAADERYDLRSITPTVEELLDAAVGAGFGTVHAQLLAAGRQRTTPAVFNLIEMARGFRNWCRANPAKSVRLIVHVVAPDVLFNVDTNRIDVPAILLTEDVRFWVEVSERGQTAEMRAVSFPADTLIEKLVEEIDVPRHGWELLIRPSPDGAPDPVHVGTAIGRRETLLSLGVIPHSVVIFRRSAT